MTPQTGASLARRPGPELKARADTSKLAFGVGDCSCNCERKQFVILQEPCISLNMTQQCPLSATSF